MPLCRLLTTSLSILSHRSFADHSPVFRSIIFFQIHLPVFGSTSLLLYSLYFKHNPTCLHFLQVAQPTYTLYLSYPFYIFALNEYIKFLTPSHLEIVPFFDWTKTPGNHSKSCRLFTSLFGN